MVIVCGHHGLWPSLSIRTPMWTCSGHWITEFQTLASNLMSLVGYVQPSPPLCHSTVPWLHSIDNSFFWHYSLHMIATHRTAYLKNNRSAQTTNCTSNYQIYSKTHYIKYSVITRRRCSIFRSESRWWRFCRIRRRSILLMCSPREESSVDKVQYSTDDNKCHESPKVWFLAVTDT